ncbi:MAG: DUF4214 domain-containing protein [Desulfovibrionaceae bacterium]|nr:DUF4214 domain-containing protein [Desulfovibrionaceae bacterium]
MAQYESGQTATQEQVTELTNNSSLSDATRAQIESLVASGKDVSLIGSDSATEKATVASQTSSAAAVAASNATLESLTLSDATALAFSNTSGNVNANAQQPVSGTFNDSSNLNLNVNNNADNDISLGGSTGTTNVNVNLGNGDNNVTLSGESASNVGINAGNGNNIMQLGNAQSSGAFTDISVTTGDGNDSIGIEGTFTGQITTGAGDLDLALDASTQADEHTSISVDAGEGFDLLRLIGRMVKHAFEFSNGKFHMHSGNIEMTGVNVIATDSDGDGVIENGTDHITILATTEEDSLIAKLYKVALGREAIDDANGWNASTLGGFNWWTNEYEKTNDITNHEQLVRAFLNCDEFHNKYDAMDDVQYVNQLFTNLGVSDSAAAQDYINQLANGSIDRETVAWQIATSETAVKVLGSDGEQYVIDGDFTQQA